MLLLQHPILQCMSLDNYKFVMSSRSYIAILKKKGLLALILRALTDDIFSINIFSSHKSLFKSFYEIAIYSLEQLSQNISL